MFAGKTPDILTLCYATNQLSQSYSQIQMGMFSRISVYIMLSSVSTHEDCETYEVARPTTTHSLAADKSYVRHQEDGAAMINNNTIYGNTIQTGWSLMGNHRPVSLRRERALVSCLMNFMAILPHP